MSSLEIESMMFIPAIREAKEFIAGLELSARFPADRRVAVGEGVIGMVIVNGSIAGALTKQHNFQQLSKNPTVYVLYNGEGKFELDYEVTEAALAASGQEKVRKRNVSMTDSDKTYLTQIGGGNVSAGIRVAVEVVRASRGWASA